MHDKSFETGDTKVVKSGTIHLVCHTFLFKIAVVTSVTRSQVIGITRISRKVQMPAMRTYFKRKLCVISYDTRVSLCQSP